MALKRTANPVGLKKAAASVGPQPVKKAAPQKTVETKVKEVVVRGTCEGCVHWVPVGNKGRGNCYRPRS